METKIDSSVNSYRVKTSYLSCGGVVNATRSFDSFAQSMIFAHSCICSLSYDTVQVLQGNYKVLVYLRPETL